MSKTVTPGPVTQGIDHLGLSVSDLAASKAFFEQALGWTQFGGWPDYPSVFMTDGVSRLTLWQCKGGEINGFDRHANVGLHHLALKVTTGDALREVFATVSKWPGVVVEFAPELAGKGPREHFMIYEPGGVRIEVSYTPA
ncbi:MAG TPA: VOC family protein [Afipia sp.]